MSIYSFFPTSRAFEAELNKTLWNKKTLMKMHFNSYSNEAKKIILYNRYIYLPVWNTIKVLNCFWANEAHNFSKNALFSKKVLNWKPHHMIYIFIPLAYVYTSPFLLFFTLYLSYFSDFLSISFQIIKYFIQFSLLRF